MPRPPGPDRTRTTGARVACALVLLGAAVFHLWDGRRLEVGEWIRHGDEYVVTLASGEMQILRQSEIRRVEERPAAAPAPPAGRPAPPGTSPAAPAAPARLPR